jgi:hypothetical protein
MNKKIIGFCLSIGIAGCGDTINIDTHGKRITKLEQRADLNDQLDALQDQLIALNQQGLVAANLRIDELDAELRDLIQDEADARAAADAALQAGLDAEAAAREAGDDALADAIAAETSARQAADQALLISLAAVVGAQTLVNLAVQYQLSLINSKFPLINSKLTSLQNQMNSANANISSLQTQINNINVDVADLEARMLAAEGDISSLEDSLDALQIQVDQEGVKVYKCNASTSKERIFKINGKFYAVMNHVTMKSIKVVTGSSSQNYATPLMCSNNGGSLKLADNGNCTGGGWSPLAGTGLNINVPSNSTEDVNVVTKVQMALEPLNDGSYQTTDGAAACTFSISGGGLVSSNLIHVQ